MFSHYDKSTGQLFLAFKIMLIHCRAEELDALNHHTTQRICSLLALLVSNLLLRTSCTVLWLTNIQGTTRLL
jgi:hypothetical protein